jgi:hypothetical protein
MVWPRLSVTSDLTSKRAANNANGRRHGRLSIFKIDRLHAATPLLVIASNGEPEFDQASTFLSFATRSTRKALKVYNFQL